MSRTQDRLGRDVAPPSDEEREHARQMLKARRKFEGDVAVYLIVNAFLVVLWWTTDGGYFWPGWVMGGWGIFLALDAWNVFGRRPITEADVDAEVARRRG